MAKNELVMIVAPLMGHLAQAIDMVKLMLARSNQLSITALIMNVQIDPAGSSKINSIIEASTMEGLRIVHLPTPEDHSLWASDGVNFLMQLIDSHKPHVRQMVAKIGSGLSGLIVDGLTATMIDVADEFGVPGYVFSTSGAACQGLGLYFQALEDEQNQELVDLLKNATELIIPSFANPVPVSVLPMFATNKEHWSSWFLPLARGKRRAKAILVNTFAELEAHAINSFMSDSSYGKSRVPPIYPVGPIINRLQTEPSKDHSDIINWLDDQPPSSVVFLCFGSKGSFQGDQLKEIGYGLERSGCRFLWSLRQSKGGFSSDYENFGQILPEGFLDRTATRGKIVGWVPQLAVLSHSAVQGFVSHCGWNSILESIWCGVPIATWPLYAEQQLNAFQLVKELGIAIEISLDFRDSEDQAMATAEQVEKGIRKLMDGENEVRKKVRKFSEISRLAMKEGGSSYLSLGNFIESISHDQA